MIRIFLFIFLFLCYGLLFTIQEKQVLEKEAVLKPALPVNFYRIVAGYTRQLAAEMLFVRSSVFLGGIKPGTPSDRYEAALANNFKIMTELYPRFRDPYYFTNSFLSPISSESAAKAAKIFETGITAYPEYLILHFFYATNFFLFMDKPLKAAKAFSEAATIPNAPPIFGHLAALLSAQGGDITAGLISLRAMLSSEKNEIVRQRYEEEIVIFEKALNVQKALQAYVKDNGNAPDSLSQLVPEYLEALPVIKDSFVLEYTPPNLSLKRPSR